MLYEEEKNGITLELYERWPGGVMAQSKVKGTLFTIDRFPLGSLLDLGELSTPEPIDLDTICIQVVCEAVDNQANI